MEQKFGGAGRGRGGGKILSCPRRHRPRSRTSRPSTTRWRVEPQSAQYDRETGAVTDHVVGVDFDAGGAEGRL